MIDNASNFGGLYFQLYCLVKLNQTMKMVELEYVF